MLTVADVQRWGSEDTERGCSANIRDMVFCLLPLGLGASSMRFISFLLTVGSVEAT